MSGEISTLQQMRKLQEEEKLGFLGDHILFTSYVYSVISYGTKTQEQVMEDLKDRVIYVEFGTYGSSIEKNVLESAGSKSKPRNFTLYMGVEGSGIMHHPMHFYWNGSWEGLDDEMRIDVEILRNVGFKIEYKGHNPKHDIIF